MHLPFSEKKGGHQQKQDELGGLSYTLDEASSLVPCCATDSTQSTI